MSSEYGDESNVSAAPTGQQWQDAAKRRYDEWQSEHEAVERKHTELLTSQSKMVREQMGVLCRDVAVAQYSMEEMKHASHQSIMLLKKDFNDSQQELIKERTRREEMEVRLSKEMEQLGLALKNEVKRREQYEAADITAALKTNLDAVSESVAVLNQGHEEALRNIDMLRDDVDTFLPQVEALRHEISVDSQDRRVELDSMTGCMRESHESLLKELRLREATAQEELDKLRGSLEKGLSDHDLHLTTHANNLQQLERDLSPHKDQVPLLHSRCQELEASLNTKYLEHQQNIDKVISERTTSQAWLEQRFTEILSKIEHETATRNASVEEIEQMLTTHKSKLRSLSDNGEAAKQATDARLVDYQRVMEEEKVTRESQQRAVQEQLSSQRQAWEMRIDSLQKQQRDSESRIRADVKQEREDLITKKTEEQSRSLRDLREVLSGRILEERSTRESAVLGLEEQITFINRFFQDVGERYSGASGVVSRSKRLSAPTSQSRPQSVGYPVGGFAATPSMSQQHPRLMASATTSPVSSLMDAPVMKIPGLDAEREVRLTRILAEERVDLILKPLHNSTDPDDRLHGRDVTEAELRLKRTIEFDAAHHGEPPLLRNEDEVMDVMGDVSEIMKIFNMSTLLIEGHAVAPGEKADRWALELAQGRAEIIKSMIASFGIEPSRLGTVGLPGMPGIALQHEIILKFTSF